MLLRNNFTKLHKIGGSNIRALLWAATFAFSGSLIGCGDEPSTTEPIKEVTETEKPTNANPTSGKPSLDQIKEATKTAAPNQPPPPVDPDAVKTEIPKDAGALLNPALAKDTAPNDFTVLLKTTKGDVLLELHRDWAPNGVDRFYNLVKVGYFTDVAFFRVIGNFMAQFGMHGDPAINTAWRQFNIKDDKVTQSNLRGYVTFAKTNQPNSRSTQLFINYRDNTNLDGMAFAPIGKVVDEPGQGGGMAVIDSLYAEYGEGQPKGRGPSQMILGNRGNEYLKIEYPLLDYILSARVCGEGETPDAPDYCP